MMEVTTCCKVDMKLLHMKLHYFLMFGAFGAVYPYLPLLGKSLGITATGYGVCDTSHLFLAFIAKPIISSLADYFRNLKHFVTTLLLMHAVLFLGLLLLPPIDGATKSSNLKLGLLNNSHELHNITNRIAEDLKDTNRNLIAHSVIVPESIEAEGIAREHDLTSIQTETSEELKLISINTSSPNISLYYEHRTVPNETEAILDIKNSSELLLENDTSLRIYESYQFWIFFLIIVLGGLGLGNAVNLSDTACYELLGDKRHLYGQQRLWGTIGWALLSGIGGFLNDLITTGREKEDYSAGLYIMAILAVVDFLVLYKVPLIKEGISQNMYKDLKKLFCVPKNILFAVAIIFNTILHATVVSLEFWYLQDMGASQTLLGAAVVVQCLLGEVSFLAMSGWFIRKIGCFNCLVLSFVGFTIRFGLYSIIKNPWWALGIDVTHGLTFALALSALTNYVSVNANKGVEASMLGILSGLSDGVGHSTGSLLGGYMFDKFGGKFTFSVASGFGFISAILFLILPWAVEKIPKQRTKEQELFIETAL